MRWAPAATIGICALACATACGGGGGHDNLTVITQSAFPQSFLPVLLGGSGGRGDVAFRAEGDLYAVDGGPDVTAVSRADGAVNPAFAQASGANLRSIVVGFGDETRLFAGDDQGRIWKIPAAGGDATVLIDTGSEPITGLALAPSGFGEFGGSLFAAAGNAGVLRILISDTPAFSALTTNGDRYVDLVFSGTTLLAINASDKRIETVSPSGEAAPLPSTPGFTTPVGITVDLFASEIYVADGGDEVLYTVPVAGGARTARATYSFDSNASSGLAYDGLGAIAFIAEDPLAIRGAAVPRVDPANPGFGATFAGTTVGHGDLEFDRQGGFVIAANDDDDPQVPGDSTNNFLFGTSRDLTTVTSLASGIGSPIEELLGVAVDPVSQAVYFSTRRGNVYRRASDGSGTGGPLVSVTTNVPVLGLELAPKSFAAFPGWLVATTAIDTAAGTGEMFAIDPASPNPPVRITLNQTVSHLSDLVFSSEGALYVVDNDTTTSRILRVTVSGTSGTVTLLAGSSVQLGRADGIEIDEGANRLLVTSETAGGGRLLAVDLDSGAVTALANIDIPLGSFPTGVVYDRLGTAVVRERRNATALVAHSVAP